MNYPVFVTEDRLTCNHSNAGSFKSERGLCFEYSGQRRAQGQLPTTLSFHVWAQGFQVLAGAPGMGGANVASDRGLWKLEGQRQASRQSRRRQPPLGQGPLALAPPWLSHFSCSTGREGPWFSLAA